MHMWPKLSCTQSWQVSIAGSISQRVSELNRVLTPLGGMQDLHLTLDMSGTVISKSNGFGAGTSLPWLAGACSRSIAIVACTRAAYNL